VTPRLTSAQSRLLAAALLLLVIALVVAAIGVPTLLLHKRYDNHLDDFSDRLQRYRRVAALRPQIDASIAEVEARMGRQFYLKATTPSSAAAELQALVTRVIEANKGRIVTSQVLPVKDEGKAGEPIKAAISVQMNASIIQLLIILHALESNQPYVFVDQLTVRAGQGRAYRPVPGAEPDYVVQLAVSGFAPAGAGKP